MADQAFENIQTSQFGLAPIISGTPKYIGQPVDDIVKVGAQLTQRANQNQQYVMSTDAALANMPVANNIDKSIVKAAQDTIDKSIKPIIDNDNWHKADSLVMDIAKSISSNPELTNVSKNAQLRQQYLSTINDTKIPEAYKQAFIGMADESYVKNGGAVDAKGQLKSYNPVLPNSDMDISKYITKLGETISSLKADKQTFISGVNTFDLPGIEQANNLGMADVWKQAYLSNTTVESLTDDRIREMAIAYLKADPEFNNTAMDISRVRHFQANGTSAVTKKNLESVLLDKDRPYVKSFAIQSSPMYKNKVADIRLKYSKDINSGNSETSKKAVSNMNKELNDLLINQDIYYKDGLSTITKDLSESDIYNLYHSLNVNEIFSSVVDTTKGYGYTKQDQKLELVDNPFVKELFDIKFGNTKRSGSGKKGETEEESMTDGIAWYDASSYVQSLPTDVFNPNSTSFKQMESLKDRYLATPTTNPNYTLYKDEYFKSKAVYDSYLEVARDNYNSLSADQKKSISETKFWDGFTKSYSESIEPKSSNVKNAPPLYTVDDLLTLTNEELFNKVYNKNISTDKYVSKITEASRNNQYQIFNAKRQTVIDRLNKNNQETGKEYRIPISAMVASGDSKQYVAQATDAVLRSISSGTAIIYTGDGAGEYFNGDSKNKDTKKDFESFNSAINTPLPKDMNDPRYNSIATNTVEFLNSNGANGNKGGYMVKVTYSDFAKDNDDGISKPNNKVKSKILIINGADTTIAKMFKSIAENEYNVLKSPYGDKQSSMLTISNISNILGSNNTVVGAHTRPSGAYQFDNTASQLPIQEYIKNNTTKLNKANSQIAFKLAGQNDKFVTITNEGDSTKPVYIARINNQNGSDTVATFTLNSPVDIVTILGANNLLSNPHGSEIVNTLFTNKFNMR